MKLIDAFLEYQLQRERERWREHFIDPDLLEKISKMKIKEVTKYLSTIGRKGGKAKSDAKKKAARKNGKLGGRPTKAKKESKTL